MNAGITVLTCLPCFGCLRLRRFVYSSCAFTYGVAQMFGKSAFRFTTISVADSRVWSNNKEQESKYSRKNCTFEKDRLLPPQRRLCFRLCWFICDQLYTKSYERIWIKFSGKVRYNIRTNWLDFVSNQDSKKFLKNFLRFLYHCAIGECPRGGGLHSLSALF